MNPAQDFSPPKSPKPDTALNGFEAVSCRDGSFTLRDLSHGQTMHSAIGAWAEANALYANPTPLDRPLTVLDVGMGIATNPLALITRWEKEGRRHPLQILSIEKDLYGIRWALDQGSLFPWLSSQRKLVEDLLCSRAVDRDRLSWRLWEGDLAEFSMPGLNADVIYFDMYSPAHAETLWTSSIFARLSHSGAPSHTLLTYSSARKVRDALMQAGYEVTSGPSTPLKRDTTVATLKSP